MVGVCVYNSEGVIGWYMYHNEDIHKLDFAGYTPETALSKMMPWLLLWECSYCRFFRIKSGGQFQELRDVSVSVECESGDKNIDSMIGQILVSS